MPLKHSRRAPQTIHPDGIYVSSNWEAVEWLANKLDAPLNIMDRTRLRSAAAFQKGHFFFSLRDQAKRFLKAARFSPTHHQLLFFESFEGEELSQDFYDALASAAWEFESVVVERFANNEKWEWKIWVAEKINLKELHS